MESNAGLLIVGIVVQFLLGGAFGWWLRGSPKVQVVTEPMPEELRDLVAENRRRADEMQVTMSTLQQLTGGIGKEVGDHSNRVQQISSDLSTAAAGKNGVELQMALQDAVREVTTANEKLQNQLQDAERKLAEQAHVIQKHIEVARTDSLTGVLNRRAFDEEISRRVAEFQRYRTPVSLLMADIDFFKKFNDTHGHQAGDEVIKLTARTLTGAMRDVDLVCRYGGEEFAVILPATELLGGGMAADRARTAIEAAVLEFEDKTLHVTLSAGVASVMPGDDVSQLIKRADAALYQSKHSGRNCAHYHDGEKIYRTGDIPAHAAPAVEAPAKPAAPVAAAPDNDPLHQLPNSEAFQNELRRRLEQQRKYRTPVTVLLTAIDNLAMLRERHGEEGASLIVRAAAQLLKATSHEHDTLARVADDRFAMVLPGTNEE
ncbi:MAG: diguanylate cyclase, partial [Planctomycetaceae bacterium]|nr:diguanylate cyclase [Planctomycetaceae bacterium]